MNNVLKDIIEIKKQKVEQKKKTEPLEVLSRKASAVSGIRSFKKALENRHGINLIAEIKKATPSLGIICRDFNPEKIAREYEQAGAAAISVLTEEKYFLGDLAYLEVVRKRSRLPILRKDFVVDGYQIYEALVRGADAVLLIAGILEENVLKELFKLSKKIGIDALVEIHNEEDLEKALIAGADIIGINNRNLNDLSVDLSTSEKLYPKVPKDKVVVAESGIRDENDIKFLSGIGINSFLVGNTLMTSRNVKSTIEKLKGI